MSHTLPDQTLTSFLADFLTAVRTELSDLSVEERAEITDGLEADLAELIAERGPGALGDPVAYARELRSAAGIPERGSMAKSPRSLGQRVTALLDRSHAFVEAQIDRLPGDPQPVLDWLRPAWWLARGMAVGGLWAVVTGSFGLESWLVGVLGAIASIQLGRGRYWPGGRRSLGPRLTLLGINAVALLAIGISIGELGNVQYSDWQRGYDSAWSDAQEGAGVAPDSAGVYSRGYSVTQIFPYDASGRPLVGVQLFDQRGKPIKVEADPSCDSTAANPLPPEEPTADGELNYTCTDEDDQPLQPRIFYPWTNGAAQLYNVFPLTSRAQNSPHLSATAFAEQDPPAVGTLPFATVPPISLPGIVTSQIAVPATAAPVGAPAKK